MVGLLLENKMAAEAASKIAELKKNLRASNFRFGEIAPILLTDNGGEFSIVSSFENDTDGNLESHMFFCEPCSPHEKAHIEKNHTLFRDVAALGGIHRVTTQVAIALGASVQPFTNITPSVGAAAINNSGFVII